MISLTHIINPVKVPETSDLYKAQPITFETMRRAKEFSKGHLNINLVTTQYEEDKEIIPDYFDQTQDLTRSVMDCGHFKEHRKLPLIHDILSRAVTYEPIADFMIYTNVDIALMPHFYLFVKEKIQEGCDAFVINRRTISAKYTMETLAQAYGDFGKSHPGFDCFIFKLSLVKKFVTKEVCIGTTRIGLVLIANLIMHSIKFRIFKSEHLTFHIGEDRIWQNSIFQDYVAHNEKEAFEILQIFKSTNSKKFENNELMMKYYLDLFNKTNVETESMSSTFIKKISRFIK